MKPLTSMLCAMLMCWTFTATAADTVAERSEQMFQRAFSSATSEERSSRLVQDQVQALCSLHRNAPPADIAAKIVELSRASMRYPEDGKLLGDWKLGAKLAGIGTGGHIGRVQPDRPDTPKGGNCYACHKLARNELAAGNLGPELTGYGKRFGTSPESLKFVYEKIYNAQAYFPCSHMPRFGANGWLTPKDIADAVAYLLDPASPVNQ